MKIPTKNKIINGSNDKNPYETGLQERSNGKL
jgi:hypothetical protein